MAWLKTDLEQQEAELSLNRGSAIAMIENEKRVDVTLLLRDKPEIDEDVLKKYDDADVDVGSDGFDSSRSVLDRLRRCINLACMYVLYVCMYACMKAFL